MISIIKKKTIAFHLCKITTTKHETIINSVLNMLLLLASPNFSLLDASDFLLSVLAFFPLLPAGLIPRR